MKIEPDISSRYDVLLSHNDSHHNDEYGFGCKQYDRVKRSGLQGGQSPQCRKLEIRHKALSFGLPDQGTAAVIIYARSVSVDKVAQV